MLPDPPQFCLLLLITLPLFGDDTDTDTDDDDDDDNNENDQYTQHRGIFSSPSFLFSSLSRSSSSLSR